MLIALFSGDAAAEGAMERLQRFLSQTQTMEGRFQQTAHEGGESAGYFWMVKPGQFYWRYDTPFEQHIVSDGVDVWLYEPDLNQAIRSRQAEMRNTPASMLASWEQINEAFEVSEGEQHVKHGQHVQGEFVRLVPRKEAGFRELLLVLHPDPSQDKIVGLVLRDLLENRSLFHFSSLRWNQPIPKEKFRFHPPSGVDIVESIRP